METCVQNIVRGIEVSPDNLMCPAEQKESWLLELAFVMMNCPEWAGKYMRATSRDEKAAWDALDELFNGSNKNTHHHPDVINVWLDLSRRVKGEGGFQANLKEQATRCLRDIFENSVNNRAHQWSFETLEMMMGRHGLATLDLGGGDRIAHIAARIAIDAQVQDETFSLRGKLTQSKFNDRATAGKIFKMIEQYGGSLEETNSEGDTALMEATKFYEVEEAAELTLLALVDSGADWARAWETVGEKSRTLLRKHPRIASHLLGEIAEKHGGDKPPLFPSKM